MSFFKQAGWLLTFIGGLWLASPSFAAEGSANSFQDLFGAAQDNIDPTESATNKVKLSGRQMMLSESIVKSLCFASLGIEVDKNLIAAAQASSLFSETLNALSSGSVQKSIIRESDPEILAYLKLVSDSWRPFKNTVNSVLTTREPTPEDIQKLQSVSEDILLYSTMTSRAIEAHYSDGGLGEEIATTIGVAGHQRTLIETATKHFCLIVADIDPEEHRDSLTATREIFFDSIFDLFFGNQKTKVIPPTNLEVELIFQEQFAIWFTLEDLFDVAMEAGSLDDTSLELSLNLTDYLVEQSENALARY